MIFPSSRPLLRDITAILVVALFFFPIAWTALDSIKPVGAVYSFDRVVLFDFVPTLDNYRSVFGQGGGLFDGQLFDGRKSMLDSIIVAFGATALGLMLALPAAYAIWRLGARQRRRVTLLVLGAWLVPPIALIWPVFQLYHATGLFDTHAGLILAQAAIHLPFAVLVLSSLFSDLPIEVAEAARLDGAGEWVVFQRIVIPMLRGGITATAILFFIFCWTEFFLSLFLSAFTRLMPVQIANMSSAAGGSMMALSTAALLPGFVFVLLVQKHLARGMTLGIQRT